MAADSSTLAWKIPWTEEPGGLPSMGWHSQTWPKRLSSSSSNIQKYYWDILHSFFCTVWNSVCVLYLWIISVLSSYVMLHDWWSLYWTGQDYNYFFCIIIVWNMLGSSYATWKFQDYSLFSGVSFANRRKKKNSLFAFCNVVTRKFKITHVT